VRAELRHFFGTLTGRLLKSAALWSIAALAVGGLVLSLVFRSYVLSDVDNRLSLLIDSMVGVSEISPEGVIRFSRPLSDQRFMTPESGQYWQINEAGQEPFRSRSLWDFELTPDVSHRSFSLKYYETDGPDGQTLRIAERDIILPQSDRLFHFQVGTDMAEVTAAIAEFNWLLVSALGLIMVTVTTALVLQVSYGLRPLRKLGRSLIEIRTGKENRIKGDWPQDLQPLAQEINALIEQNEKLVDRARTHVGNLAHALKTPLAVIQNEVEGLSDKSAKRIYSQSKLIHEHVDHHLKRARIAGGGTGAGLPIKDRLQKIIKAVAVTTHEKDVDYQLDCPETIKFDGEKEDFDEILGNLIDNAGKWTEAKVKITAAMVTENLRRPFMEIRVEDDGPGVGSEDIDTLFERGRRLDERVPGTGLGLAIVRDIVEMYGGQAMLESVNPHGLRAVLRLPAK